MNWEDAIRELERDTEYASLREKYLAEFAHLTVKLHEQATSGRKPQQSVLLRDRRRLRQLRYALKDVGKYSEYFKAKGSAYRAGHKEQIRAKNNAYYQAHCEKIKQQRATPAWKKYHKEYGAKWYRDHCEEIKARKRELYHQRKKEEQTDET